MLDLVVWLTRDLSAVTKRKIHAQIFRILNQDEYLSKRSSRKCVCTGERKQETLRFLISGSSAGKHKGRINAGCSGQQLSGDIKNVGSDFHCVHFKKFFIDKPRDV